MKVIRLAVVLLLLSSAAWAQMKPYGPYTKGTFTEQFDCTDTGASVDVWVAFLDRPAIQWYFGASCWFGGLYWPDYLPVFDKEYFHEDVYFITVHVHTYSHGPENWCFGTSTTGELYATCPSNNANSGWVYFHMRFRSIVD